MSLALHTGHKKLCGLAADSRNKPGPSPVINGLVSCKLRATPPSLKAWAGGVKVPIGRVLFRSYRAP